MWAWNALAPRHRELGPERLDKEGSLASRRCVLISGSFACRALTNASSAYTIRNRIYSSSIANLPAMEIAPFPSIEELQRAADVQAALGAFERGEERQLSPGRDQIAKIRYTHDAMIDLIIANPTISQGQLSKHFGYTEGWVSTVINSDMFQAKLAQRREQIIDPTLRLSLEERFRAVTTRSLQVLQEKLSKDPSQVPDNLVLKAVELGAKALGVGGNAPPPSLPNDHLAGLADRLLLFQTRARTGVVNEQLQQVDIVEEAVIVREVAQGGQGTEASHPQAGGEATQADGGR